MVWMSDHSDAYDDEPNAVVIAIAVLLALLFLLALAGLKATHASYL